MKKVYYLSKTILIGQIFNFEGMKKCKKLKLFLIALIIAVQGVHSGTAFISIRLGEQINRSGNKPNNFDYQNHHQYLIAKLSIALSIANIFLLVTFIIRKLLYPNAYGILYVLMATIIICIQILLIMDSSYRYCYRKDLFQIKADKNISDTYEDLNKRLFVLASIQLGLSLIFQFGGIIIFSIELYQARKMQRRNQHDVYPLKNQEEQGIQQMRQE